MRNFLAIMVATASLAVASTVTLAATPPPTDHAAHHPAAAMGTPAAAQMMDADKHFMIMLNHHEMMTQQLAQLAVTKASHPELKSFAQNTVSDAAATIDQLQRLYAVWYGGPVPSPAPMDMQMMMSMHDMMGAPANGSSMGASTGASMGTDGMMGMDMTLLQPAKDFDKTFTGLLLHHDLMGAAMTSMTLSHPLQRSELASLSSRLLTAQLTQADQLMAEFLQVVHFLRRNLLFKPFRHQR